jgi:hypothetical protein
MILPVMFANHQKVIYILLGSSKGHTPYVSKYSYVTTFSKSNVFNFDRK